MAPRRLAFAALIAALAIAAPAHADEQAARAAMERGVVALSQGNAQAALALFEQAITEVPEAPVPYRFAGEALERLARWDEAVARYRTYLTIRPDSRDAEEVRARIQRIARAHLEGALAVRCRPDGAAVQLDGASIGVTPVERGGVPRGNHVVDVRADLHLPRRLEVTVTPGATTVVDCDLSRLPEAPVPARPPSAIVHGPTPTKPPAQKPWYRRPWVWIAAGAVVVAGGALTYVALPDLPDTTGGEVHFP